MAKVLIIEDDEALSVALSKWLRFKHYIVESVADGIEGFERLQCFEFDVVILDWMLPGMSGIQICRDFRALGGSTPIIMLTGRNAMEDKEAGFSAGADDYLTKPFNPEELALRIRALLCRPSQYRSDVLKLGPVVLDSSNHRVQKNDREVQLQPMEFTLLEFLMKHPNEVFGTEALLRRVWESETEASLDAIYTCIRRIRKKLDTSGQPSIIRTVHSMGYKLGC